MTVTEFVEDAIEKLCFNFDLAYMDVAVLAPSYTIPDLEDVVPEGVKIFPNYQKKVVVYHKDYSEAQFEQIKPLKKVL